MGHFCKYTHISQTVFTHLKRSLDFFRVQIKLLPTCEGVHEGGQGSVEHLEERVSAGILLRSTKHCVLQDVWDPCAIHGGRPELDTETQKHI